LKEIPNMKNQVAFEEPDVAFEEHPDGELALRLLAAMQDQYGEDAQVPVDVAISSCAWS
jgi:hypothetical protein